MQIGTQRTFTVSRDPNVAKTKTLQEFRAMQAAMLAQNTVTSFVPGAMAASTATAPLVSSIPSALSGSPSDVFARAGVINITEPTRARVTFEGADTQFRNTLIMYKLDEKGTFKEAQTIFPNATSVESGGWMKSGQSSTVVELQAGDRLGFALLPNGFANQQSRELLMREDGKLGLVDWRGQPANMLKDSPENVQLVHIDEAGKMQAIRGEYGNKLLHSTGNASQGVQTNYGGRDYADQIVDAERGKLLMGFDDKLDGTGRKRNSMLATVNLGKTNAAALNPAPVADRPASFREVAGADRKANTGEIMETAKMFDADGDGRLNEGEWAKFAPLLNLKADDHKHLLGVRGRGDIDSLPHLIQKGDTDGDGKIGELERLAMSRRLNGNNPNLIQSFREAAGVDMKLDYDEFLATAEAFDKNGDGFDQAEWDRFAPVLGMTPEDRKLFLNANGKFDISKFKTVFEVADTNGDGQLDPDEVIEMRRLVLEHFAEEDNAADDDGMRIQPYPFPIVTQPSMPGSPGQKPGGWAPAHIAGLDMTAGTVGGKKPAWFD